MKDEAASAPLTSSDEQTVTRRRVMGLAVAALGVTMLAGRAAHADDDTLGEDEDEQDITEDDSGSDGEEDGSDADEVTEDLSEGDSQN